MQLGHIALYVRDMEKTLDFYCRVLGFAHWFDMTNDAGEITTVYVKVADRQFIEFFQTKEARPPGGNYGHLCLHTDDLPAALETLRLRGYDPGESSADGRIAKGKAGSIQAWVTDPDGNRIELMQLMPESMHLKPKRRN